MHIENEFLILVTFSFFWSRSRASESRAHASLGTLYELLHDTDKAIDHHEHVREFFPNAYLLCSMKILLLYN